MMGTVYTEQLPKKQVVIYIHGTVMSGVALLNATGLYKNDLQENDWTRGCLLNLRHNQKIVNSQVASQTMGLNGIDKISLDEYSNQRLPSVKSKAGAYQYFGLYNTLNKNNPDYAYYTFGWLGGLDRKCRELAAKKLHQYIADLSKFYEHNCEFTLICHSHGGNVALNLAQEEKANPQKIRIKNLLLFGTPIQPETAYYATDNLFGTVYNFYGAHDFIQIADKISMPSHKSYHTFAKALDPEKLNATQNNIYDIQLLIDGDAKAIGHEMLGAFHNYKKSKIGKKSALFKHLTPFPLSVLAPLYLELLKSIPNITSYNPMFINIASLNDQIELQLKTDQYCSVTEILPNMQQLSNAHTYAEKNWVPINLSNKTMIILKTIREQNLPRPTKQLLNTNDNDGYSCHLCK